MNIFKSILLTTSFINLISCGDGLDINKDSKKNDDVTVTPYELEGTWKISFTDEDGTTDGIFTYRNNKLNLTANCNFTSGKKLQVNVSARYEHDSENQTIRQYDGDQKEVEDGDYSCWANIENGTAYYEFIDEGRKIHLYKRSTKIESDTSEKFILTKISD